MAEEEKLTAHLSAAVETCRTGAKCVLCPDSIFYILLQCMNPLFSVSLLNYLLVSMAIIVN